MFRNTDPVPASLRATSLGAALPEAELRALVRKGTYLRLGADRQLMSENGLGREVILVLDGSVLIQREGSTIARLGSGEIVGEMAVVAGVLRNAAVVTAEKTEAYVFSRREFTALLDCCPALERQIHLGVIERSLAS